MSSRKTSVFKSEVVLPPAPTTFLPAGQVAIPSCDGIRVHARDHLEPRKPRPEPPKPQTTTATLPA